MRVYISGPMTGYPDYNRPAFQNAARNLRLAGHDPIDPSRHPEQPSWADYMRLDLADLVEADAVALLPGWEASRGARLEVDVAHALGITTSPIWLLTAPAEEASR